MKARLILLLGLVLGLSLAIAPAVTAHHPNRHGGLPSQIDLPNGWQPEGITAGRGTTFYVGSIAGGAIWKGNFGTGSGRVLVPAVTGQVTAGVEYDWRKGRIWVAGGPTGDVRVYNAGSGKLLETYHFTSATPPFLNDLVVTRKAVYVTDSFNQQLDVIPLGRHGKLPTPDKAYSLPLTGDIHYATGFNANGIVARSGWLILVQSNTGKLFRVDAGTGVARAIDLGGYSALNGDGLERHGRTLYVVRNSNVVAVFRLGARLESAALLGELTSPGLDVPTTAAFSLGHLWVVNARFTTPPTPTTPYWITRLPARP
jgi:sugar lactone lactonase YvrE